MGGTLISASAVTHRGNELVRVQTNLAKGVINDISSIGHPRGQITFPVECGMGEREGGREGGTWYTGSYFSRVEKMGVA